MSRKIILMADGDTDYLFAAEVLCHDPEVHGIQIQLLRPEDVSLRRRTGGGHITLLREIGLAAIRAAQGYADGVLVLVDNDGDDRFKFPHDRRCDDCRECDAWAALERVSWGQPFRRGATILYQAVETLVLSARNYFTPQIEENLFSSALRKELYKRDIVDIRERYRAFESELEGIQLAKIKARSYPRFKRSLLDIAT